MLVVDLGKEERVCMKRRLEVDSTSLYLIKNHNVPNISKHVKNQHIIVNFLTSFV